jgi:hypothetical protein
MAISATAILKTIRELLDGDIGSIRTIGTAAMSPGHTPWHGQVLSQPRFDIQVINRRRHPGSPISALANRRVSIMDLQIDVRHQLSANIREDARETTRALVETDIDAMVQALHYPGNLTQTASGTTTGIMDGLLLNLESGLIEESWEERPQMLTSRINAEAWVVITQATS